MPEVGDATTRQVELFIKAGRPKSALCIALVDRVAKLPWGRIGFSAALAVGVPAAAIYLPLIGEPQVTRKSADLSPHPTLATQP